MSNHRDTPKESWEDIGELYGVIHNAVTIENGELRIQADKVYAYFKEVRAQDREALIQQERERAIAILREHIAEGKAMKHIISLIKEQDL